jgi:hypothetical protein
MLSGPYDDEIANRMYYLGRLAARRVNSRTLTVFRDWIDEAWETVGDYPYFKAWLEICARGPTAVEAVLSDPSEYGRYMRSVATLRPFVSKQERDSVYKQEFKPPAELR